MNNFPRFAGLSVALLCCIVGSGVALAAPTDLPEIDLSTGGVAVSAVTDGSAYSSVSDAPNSLIASATNQTITKTWESGHFGLADRNVVAPEGWTVEYLTSATAWNATIPSDLNLVTGVRARSSFNSVGTAARKQVSISTAQTTLKQQSLGSLTVTGLGDGYDVFFDEDHTKVFNVFHHGTAGANNNKIDCHELSIASSGARCAGYPISMPLSLGTNDRSTGAVVGTKVWVPVGRSSNPGGGFACFLVSGGLCPTSFVSMTTNVLNNVHSNVGNIAQVDNYLFAQNFKDGKLLCLDGDTGLACAGMPAGGFSIGNSPMLSWPSNLIAVGTRIYSNDGAASLGCLDTATWAKCTGWETPWSITKKHSVFALPNANGAIIGVCMFDATTAECVQEDKTTLAVPASLSAARLAVPHKDRGAVAELYKYNGYQTGPRTVGSRTYWVNFVFNNADAVGQGGTGKIACWDASLNSGAGGQCVFSNPTGANPAVSANVILDNAYSLVVDPDNPQCIWTNDDGGEIKSFDTLTGIASCPIQDAIVRIPYDDAIPRFSCAESGRVRTWDKITVTATLTSPRELNNLKLTIKRGGLPLAGWTDRALTNLGELDLSTLNVSVSGTKPTFEVTAAGLTNVEATSILGYVKYSSDAPQLCVNLKALTYCPTGVGTAPQNSVARANDAVDLVVSYSDTNSTYELSDTTSVSRTDVANCLGVLRGNVSQSGTATPGPISNQTVELKDSSGNVVESVTTDSTGNYTFTNLYPHAYTVVYGSVSKASVVSANLTTTKDFVLDAVVTPTTTVAATTTVAPTTTIASTTSTSVASTTTTEVAIAEKAAIAESLPRSGSDTAKTRTAALIALSFGVVLLGVVRRRRAL